MLYYLSIRKVKIERGWIFSETKVLLTYDCIFTFSAPKTFNLDIALVKLVRPVRLTELTNVACLPEPSDSFPPGTVCVTAGWGHTVEGKHCIITKTSIKKDWYVFYTEERLLF